MELQNALLLALAVFAVLQFGFLPRLKTNWARLPFDKQLRKFGAIALLDKLRDYSLTAAICFGAFAIAVLVASSHVGASVPALMRAMARVRSANEFLKHFKHYWTTWIFLLSFCLLWAAWYRSAKAYATDSLAKIRRGEYERLSKLRDEHPEQWEDLPPTAEMDEVWGELQKTVRDLDEVRVPERTPQQEAKLIEYAQQLSAVWTFLDFDRRLEVPWSTAPVNQSGVLGDVKRFVSSRGFLADMKGFGKLLSHASFALLALTMVGFAAGAASESLKEQSARLSDLQITTAEKETDVALRSMEAQQPEPDKQDNQQMTPQDQHHIRSLSRHLAREVRGERQWPSTEPDLRYEAAKEQIREETVLAAAGSDASNPVGSPEVSGFEQSPHREDALAEKIEQTLTAEAKRNPGVLEKIRTWGGRYNEPASVDDLRDYFLEQITDALFDTVPKPKTPLSEKAAGLVTDALKKSASELLKTDVNRLMISILRDVPPDAAWRDIGDQGSVTVAMNTEALDRLRKQYPEPVIQKEWASLEKKKREAILSTEDAAINGHIEVALSEMPKHFVFDNQIAISELVSTYESQFPLSANPYSRDTLFNSITGIRNDAVSRGIDVAQVDDTDSVATRAARAGDIEALRNYSRVGGVIIGAPPASESTVHLSDMFWETTGGRVRITVTSLSGGNNDLGPFDTDVVHRALAYAVDGRAAAVTVLNAELIGRQQVMMHPALRDSLLGAQIGRADEWVFGSLDPDRGDSASGLRKSELALYGATQLYNKALSIEKSGKSTPEEGTLSRLRETTDAATLQMFSGRTGFDERLLAIAEKCFQSTTESAFRACVLTSSTRPGWKDSISKSPKVRAEIVSQIYEQPYVLDSSLAFLRRSGDDEIWPLQFTAQMTLNDQDHVTLPQFEAVRKSQSTRIILSSIAANNETLTLQRLKDFTVLQRFFRLALSAKLGSEFPVEKLAELAHQTRPSQSSCSTPRWLNRSESGRADLEQLYATFLREVPPPSAFSRHEPKSVEEPIRERMRSCGALLDSPAAEFASSEQVGRACTLVDDEDILLDHCRSSVSAENEACVLLEVNDQLTTVAGVHRMRETLGAVRVPRHIVPACKTK